MSFAQVDRLYFRLRPLAALKRMISRAFFEGRPITTEGRWLNTLVFAHFSLQKKLPQWRKVEKPIFVVGTGRSGTTILGTIISLHKDVGFLNEPRALWHAIYPEEDVIGHYSRGPARYRLDETDASDTVRRSAHHLFGAHLAVTFSSRTVDKDPELIFRVPFVHAIFPDAKFILLVRNGWDTCYSITNWSKRYGKKVNGEAHDWWGVNNRKWKFILEQLLPYESDLASIQDIIARFESHTDMAVVEWIVTMREAMRQMQRYRDCIYLLRYEDLVSRSRISLSKLLGFCELKPDEVFMHYAEQVLSPVQPHPRFSMHPALRSAFEKVLAELNYR